MNTKFSSIIINILTILTIVLAVVSVKLEGNNTILKVCSVLLGVIVIILSVVGKRKKSK